VTATGRLTSAGAGVAGVPVRVEQRIGSTRSTVATVTTGSDGRWSWSTRANGNAVLRAAFDPARGYTGVASPEALRSVAPALATSAGARARAGDTWVVTARQPAHPHAHRHLRAHRTASRTTSSDTDVSVKRPG
jgi:hypothetical protein